ncbi:MAG: hypothetical protein M1819_006314 [Sarea resinae]|nr:MAG: hypothetical protein M1819_006314 [Sarea resinae]
MTQVPEDLAVNFFFRQYILLSGHADAPRGHLQFLPSLYTRAGPESPLTAATLAVSLAVFGNNSSRPDLITRSRLKYGQALKRTREALQDPVVSKNNDTLMTILMFGLIESVTATPDSLPQWENHTDAAILLLKSRGKGVLRDEMCLRMLYTVQKQMIFHGIHGSRNISELFHGKESALPSSADLPLPERSSPARRLTDLYLQIPDLQVLAMQLLQQPRNESFVNSIKGLIDRALELDAALALWPSTLPTTWKRTRHTRVKPTPGDSDNEILEEYPKNVDTYTDIWTASVWNSYRVARMFTLSIIIRVISLSLGGSVLDPDFENKHPEVLLIPAYGQAKERLQEMVDEVCASIPYHIGYTTDTKASRELYESQKFRPSIPDGILGAKALGGTFLISPLVVARSAMTTPGDQRRWIRGRLMAIAQQYRANIAKILAEVNGEGGWPLFQMGTLKKQAMANQAWTLRKKC